MRPVIRNANICKKNMLTICDIPIRARTMDPSFAQRNLTITQIHQSRVGGEIPSLIAKVTVNKVSIFNGIWYFVPVDVHFHYECGYNVDSHEVHEVESNEFEPNWRLDRHSVPKWSCPETSGAPGASEPNSGDSSRIEMSTSVEKV